MVSTEERTTTVHMRILHDEQQRMKLSRAKRKVVRAGRRGGKTVYSADEALDKFLSGGRVLYAAPTDEQVGAFWYEVKNALREPLETGVYHKDETKHIIEMPMTENRIRAKTAWNADTLRGDYADLLILDEYQLMNEDAWELVGAPMLLDNNGDVIFIYTPPSLRSAGVSKARDPRHASKLFKQAKDDTSGRWETFHFTSYDNPYISHDALAEITQDMSSRSIRQEILAEDEDIELSWLVYSKFNEDRCKINPFIIPHGWPKYSGHDFGTANPAALFIAQNPGPDEPHVSTRMQVRKGDYVLFKEYAPGAGISPFTHTEEWKSFNLVIKRSVGGNVNTEEETREAYRMHGWPIQAPRITRAKTQVDRVIGLMEHDRLFIFNTCFMVIGEIANCMWVIDPETNKPTNDIDNEKRYHLLAALRYIGSDFAPEIGVTSGKRRVGRYM
ncbi:hypothetical protein ACFLXA_02715 [Chloroflexota bacterium]